VVFGSPPDLFDRHFLILIKICLLCLRFLPITDFLHFLKNGFSKTKNGTIAMNVERSPTTEPSDGAEEQVETFAFNALAMNELVPDPKLWLPRSPVISMQDKPALDAFSVSRFRKIVNAGAPPEVVL
jgi:hypothetical protein